MKIITISLIIIAVYSRCIAGMSEIPYARFESRCYFTLSGNGLIVTESVKYKYLPCIAGDLSVRDGAIAEIRTRPMLIDVNGLEKWPWGQSDPIVNVDTGSIKYITWTPLKKTNESSDRLLRQRGFYAVRIEFASIPPMEFTVRYEYRISKLPQSSELKFVYCSENEAPELIPPLFYKDYHYLLTLQSHGYSLSIPPKIGRAFDIEGLTWNIGNEREVTFTFIKDASGNQ